MSSTPRLHLMVELTVQFLENKAHILMVISLYGVLQGGLRNFGGFLGA